MAELPSIKLGLYDELADPEFRRKFFVAESSAEIARQLVRLRNRRGLSQQELAERVETKQPAISRVESAGYRGWSLSNLQKIADAQDARLRVLIEPWEDVRDEYRDPVNSEPEAPSTPSASKAESARANDQRRLWLQMWTLSDLPGEQASSAPSRKKALGSFETTQEEQQPPSEPSPLLKEAYAST